MRATSGDRASCRHDGAGVSDRLRTPETDRWGRLPDHTGGWLCPGLVACPYIVEGSRGLAEQGLRHAAGLVSGCHPEEGTGRRAEGGHLRTGAGDGRSSEGARGIARRIAQEAMNFRWFFSRSSKRAAVMKEHIKGLEEVVAGTREKASEAEDRLKQSLEETGREMAEGRWIARALSWRPRGDQ